LKCLTVGLVGVKFEVEMIKKTALILVSISLLFSSLTPLVLADGMIIPPPYQDVYETAQKAVVWYENGVETLILSTTFNGKAQNFGWLIPTPTKPEVDQASDELFTALDDLTRPKYQPEPLPLLGAPPGGFEEKAVPAAPTIIETKKVDIYDITVLKATDKEGLVEWLNKNDYQYPTDRQHLLQSYIDNNWYFVAVKVDSSAVSAAGSYLESGHATPILLTFASDKIVYPLKISGLATQETKNPSNKVAYSFEKGMEGWTEYYGYEPPIGNPSLEPERGIKIKNYTINTSKATAYHGSSSIQINVTGAIENLGPLGTTLYLSGLKAGKEYTVSGYVSSPQASGSAYISTSSNNLRELDSSRKIGFSTNWQRVSHTFSPIYDWTYIHLLTDNLSLGNKVYWDAVQIEEGSQPTNFDPTAIGKTFTSDIYQKTIRHSENVTILIYVFADHKKDLPGFTTSYASWVPPQKIAKLAFTPDGSKPWREPKDKFYLTKLSRTMSPSAMTNDLILRDADNNDSVNAEGFPEFSQLRFFGVIVLILAVWGGGIGWFWWQRKRNLGENRRKI